MHFQGTPVKKQTANMNKRLLYFLLLALLLADIGYSFIQHINQPLDGDMAWNIVPADDVKPIFEHPLGIATILNNQTYANPNRFFCHWIYREYLIKVPLELQKLVNPIDSVYLACAISKIVLQVLLIILLAMAITGTKNMLRTDFMIAAVLVTPLFQTNGYRSYMGIIDPSTTYTFFYALPCAILLLYLLPIILQYYHGQKPSGSLFMKILWIPLAFIVCLSGPLNPGVVLIFSMLIILTNLAGNYRLSTQQGMIKKVTEAITLIPKNYWFYLMPVGLLSLYSLFLGRYNSITIDTMIPLSEMYSKLPAGIYYQFTQNLGFPVLFITLAINMIMINKKYKTAEGKKILNIFKWIGLFALCYFLLLPLGGYRDYRPYILRYDTIMPVTLSLILIFGVSTLFLIRNMPGKQKAWYLPVIAGVLLIYTNADNAGFDKNQCERVALKEISQSNEAVIALKHDCSVLDWRKINNPAESTLNGQLLTIWGITQEDKLYYNE